MGTSRNRNAGHQWERDIVNIMKDFGWEDAISSRWESRRRDDMGVDLCNTEPFNIQAKCAAQRVNYIKILDEMPQEDDMINVVFERKTEKRKTRFYKTGEYVHLKLEDFLKLIKRNK